MLLGGSPGLGIVFDEEKLEKLSVDTVAPGRGIPGRREGAGLYITPPSEADYAKKDY